MARSHDGEDTVTVILDLVHITRYPDGTDKSYKVRDQWDNEHWLAASLVEVADFNTVSPEFEMPVWLAEKEGLV